VQPTQCAVALVYQRLQLPSDLNPWLLLVGNDSNRVSNAGDLP
jgi:hypothetical protein